MLPGHQKKMYYNMIGAMSGQFLGHFMLYLINSTKVISSKVAKFGSMDIVELHWDILQPGGNSRPLVLLGLSVNFQEAFCITLGLQNMIYLIPMSKKP